MEAEVNLTESTDRAGLPSVRFLMEDARRRAAEELTTARIVPLAPRPRRPAMAAVNCPTCGVSE